MSSILTIPNRLLLSLGIGTGVAIASGIASYWYYKIYKRNVIPKKWRRVGTLEEFYFFPVKSCAPIQFEDGQLVDCELLGLKWNDLLDRSFMLVDMNNEMITARTYPKLVLIKTEMIDNEKLRLTAPGLVPLEINFGSFLRSPDNEMKSVRSSIWGAKLKVSLCGEMYDKWISQAVLGKEIGLKLVFYHHKNPVRAIDKNMKHEANITRKDTGTLGDATSYMLMNLSSIDDLNGRLTSPVNPIRFRGNFYLKMDHDEPYAEDHWNWLKIGDNAIFGIVAPCTRCIMPNINYVSGQRDPDGEPQKTLKTYRKVKNYQSPPLGVHMGLRQGGSVKLQDIIYVEDQ